MIDITKTDAAPGLVDAILEEFGAADHTVAIPILARNGELVATFHVRRVRSFAELEGYKARANEYVKMSCSKKDRHAAYDQFDPITPKEAAAAFAISYFSAEPSRVDEIDAMRLVKRGNPWIVSSLIEAINAEQVAGRASEFVAAVEEEKKESAVTPSIEQG